MAMMKRVLVGKASVAGPAGCSRGRTAGLGLRVLSLAEEEEWRRVNRRVTSMVPATVAGR